MNDEQNKIKVNVENGWAILPASLKLPSGAPRFQIRFPADMVNDIGVKHMIVGESQQGFDPPTIQLFERVLRPGDLFIDVGAHFGYFTFQAVTHPAADIQAISIEPDHLNSFILFRNVLWNDFTEKARVISAACGDRQELAPIETATSMGHTIRGIGFKKSPVHGPTRWVPVVTLDSALANFPESKNKRVILKVDVEGYEPQVMAGAKELLSSGRVALIVWEFGPAFEDGPERTAMLEMVDELNRHGYRHFRPLGSDDHVFQSFHPQEKYVGNVFSFSPSLFVFTKSFK